VKTKKISCIIIGKTTLITKDYYDKKLEKCGGDEELFKKTYICKEAKDLLLQGLTVEQIRQRYNTTNLPPVDISYIDSLTTNKYGIKKDTTFNTITSFTVFETDPEVKKFINTLCNVG
jgi:hypothetical protein